MATKHFCDKCKKESFGVNQLILSDSIGKAMQAWDLCQNCFNELKAKWLEWMPK